MRSPGNAGQGKPAWTRACQTKHEHTYSVLLDELISISTDLRRMALPKRSCGCISELSTCMSHMSHVASLLRGLQVSSPALSHDLGKFMMTLNPKP